MNRRARVHAKTYQRAELRFIRALFPGTMQNVPLFVRDYARKFLDGRRISTVRTLNSGERVACRDDKDRVAARVHEAFNVSGRVGRRRIEQLNRGQVGWTPTERCERTDHRRNGTDHNCLLDDGVQYAAAVSCPFDGPLPERLALRVRLFGFKASSPNVLDSLAATNQS